MGVRADRYSAFLIRRMPAAARSGKPPPLVMPEIFNPLLSAGEFLVSETSKRDGVTGLERLFVGTLDEAKQRWAASAVLDNAGAWHVVRLSDHVQGDGAARRIRLFSGGSLGRGFFRDAKWFQDNAVRIYLGALELPDGRGARAIHRVDDQEITISVRPPAGDALEGGMWVVSLLSGGAETAVLSLQEALDQVGADGATVSVLVNSPDEEPSAASQIAFSQSAEVAIEWANAFVQLGVSNADAFRGRAAA